MSEMAETERKFLLGAYVYYTPDLFIGERVLIGVWIYDTNTFYPVKRYKYMLSDVDHSALNTAKRRLDRGNKDLGKSFKMGNDFELAAHIPVEERLAMWHPYHFAKGEEAEYPF